jgi:hypothetical protein
MLVVADLIQTVLWISSSSLAHFYPLALISYSMLHTFQIYCVYYLHSIEYKLSEGKNIVEFVQQCMSHTGTL